MTSGRRVLLMIIVGALCAAAAFAIGVLVLGEFGPTQLRIMLTSAMVAVFGLLCLPAAVFLDQGGSRALAGSLIAAASIGFVLVVATIWWPDDSPPIALTRALTTVSAVAVAVAQATALLARRRDDDPRAVRACFAGSTVLGGIVAAMVIIAVCWEVEDSAVYYRSLGALVVLDLLLVALQPTLARMHATRSAAHRLRLVLDSGERVEVTLGGRDFAGAVATAVRKTEHDRGRVVRVERLERGD